MSDSDIINRLRRRLVAGGAGLLAGAGLSALSRAAPRRRRPRASICPLAMAGATSSWDAMVKRMKAVFKAPINDADMPEIVDYLAKTYGNEQPK